MSDDIDPKLKETLDQYIAWIDRATELGLEEGGPGIVRAVKALDQDQMPGMIFALVSSRVKDVEALRELGAQRVASLKSNRMATLN